MHCLIAHGSVLPAYLPQKRAAAQAACAHLPELTADLEELHRDISALEQEAACNKKIRRYLMKAHNAEELSAYFLLWARAQINLLAQYDVPQETVSQKSKPRQKQAPTANGTKASRARHEHSDSDESRQHRVSQPQKQPVNSRKRPPPVADQQQQHDYNGYDDGFAGAEHDGADSERSDQFQHKRSRDTHTSKAKSAKRPRNIDDEAAQTVTAAKSEKDTDAGNADVKSGRRKPGRPSKKAEAEILAEATAAVAVAVAATPAHRAKRRHKSHATEREPRARRKRSRVGELHAGERVLVDHGAGQLR